MRRIVCDSLCGYCKTAVMQDDELVELIVEKREKKLMQGSIFVGKIKRILPSKFMFIDLGDEKNAFLYLNDRREERLYRKNEKTGKNELCVKQGDDITVRVEKEDTAIKGAAVTSNISVAGEYCVLLPFEKKVGVSKKIDGNEKREHLKRIGEDILEGRYGLIMRTKCENADDEEIKNDITGLVEKYEEIERKSRYSLAPCEIYHDMSDGEKAMRDFIQGDDDEIIINDKDEYERIKNSGKYNNIRYYDDAIPIFERYGIKKQIDKALNKKVWLDCGGFIIIEQTEACSVIDVNTGKFTGGDHEKTVFKVNEEAASEIAKQIRLRNLSGMIIVDFIDMKSGKNIKALEEKMREEVRADRTRTTVIGMTELGLMQITRRKTRKPLAESILCDCPMCRGSGKIGNDELTADKMRREVIGIFSQTVCGCVEVHAGKELINAFEGTDGEHRKEIEEKFSKKIITKITEHRSGNRYEIKATDR
ncbi:MAG: ribonuclease E/G [Firmicutes bacterium]|nr:ribonuclease E/G [Bacillota bacterium]